MKQPNNDEMERALEKAKHDYAQWYGKNKTHFFDLTAYEALSAFKKGFRAGYLAHQSAVDENGLKDENERLRAQLARGNRSLDEALNSGDGSYKP